MNIKDYYWDFYPSDDCLCIGGSYALYVDQGLFFIYKTDISNIGETIGCRLMEI